MAKDSKARPRSMALFTGLKTVIVSLVAAVVTWQTYYYTYFETIIPGVKYGIWHGFPFGYIFNGYQVDWYQGQSIANWNAIHYWIYHNLALDFILYFIYIAAILYLVEKGLKKLLHIEW